MHYNTYQINIPNNTFELICINVLHFRLCIFYRPPSMNYENTILLCNLMSRIIDTPESTIFYGDLNLPGIDWFNRTSQTTIEKYFLNFSQKYALTQLVNFNTRQFNLLDIILTNNKMILSNIQAINPLEYHNFISVHLAISSSIIYNKISSNYNCKTFVPKLNFNKANLDLIKLELSTIDWPVVLNYKINCSSLLDIFISTVNGIISKCKPVTKRGQFIHPLHIKKLINKCKKFHSLSKSIPSYYVKWRSLQFKLYSEIKLYNIKTEEHALNSNDKSSFFKYINSKLKSNKPLSVLRSNSDGSIITNHSDILECLSLQFNSVFNNNTSPVPNIPSIICKNTFESFPLSPETIRKFLCFLPNKFNNSSDGLPKGVLKILSFKLCEPLSIIYSRFLKEGYCPDLWKHSYITPIYKKGDPTLAENYRMWY